MFYCFLAKGFEEIEAITTVDMLLRAGVDVVTVGVDADSNNLVEGAHGISVKADVLSENISLENMEGIILPGGMPGTINLENSDDVMNALDYCVNNGLYIFAICAAPQILGHKGILNGKNATCYPGFEAELEGAILSDAQAVCDGKVITSKGPGATIDFASAIITELKGTEVAGKLKESMQCV